MNALQKAIIVLGVFLFVLIGAAVLILLFGGGDFLGSHSVAVVDLEGEITGGYGITGASVGSRAMKELLEGLAEDASVVAVVLRIDSEGGGVIESKEIGRAVSKLADAKPVIAYIANMGASGAYYAASFADAIYADEDSLVGSIGVVSEYTIYKNLFEDKLGINTTVIKSGEFKDIGSPYRFMTEKEKTRLQEMVDKVHEEFLNVIIANRGLADEQVSAVRESGIFLGSEALPLGLVDYLGTLDDAIAQAALIGGAPDAAAYYVDESDYLGEDVYYAIGRGLGDSLAAKLELSAGGSLKAGA